MEKNKKRKKKETLRKQKGLPMKSEDLKYLRHFLSDLAEIFQVHLKITVSRCQMSPETLLKKIELLKEIT